MRNYEHFKVEPYGILLPDPKSAKGKWGLNCPEYMDSSDPDFLREGNTKFPQAGLIFQLTHASQGHDGQYAKNVGGDLVIVEAQDCSGGYVEMGIHKNMIEWH